MPEARSLSPVLVTLVAVAMSILVGLGVWQLNRMDEKSAFLARLARRPTPLRRRCRTRPAGAAWTSTPPT